MAIESGGFQSCSEKIPDIHIINFKYESNSELEKLRASVTDEIIKRFGNTLNLPPERKFDFTEENIDIPETVNTYSNLLEGASFQSQIKSSAVNNHYICILSEDGHVFRASFKVDSSQHAQKKENAKSTTFSQASESPDKGNKSGKTNSSSLQVASDESYARSLQRRFSEVGGRSNVLTGRRSILNRSPIHINSTDSNRGNFDSEFSIFGTPIIAQTRELLSTATATINRLSPTLRSARYMPYNRDQRHRPIYRQLMERQIQMDHLMGVSFSPSHSEQNQLFDVNISGNPVITDDGSPLTLPDSITVVGADSFDADYSFPIATVSPPMEESSRSELEERLACESPTRHSQNPTLNENVSINLNQIQEENQALKTEVSIAHGNANTKGSRTPGLKTIETFDLSKSNNKQHQFSPLKNQNQTNENLEVKPKENKVSWNPKLGEIEEAQLEEERKFEKMTAMQSGFLLVDDKRDLWIWYNDDSSPSKYVSEWNSNQNINAIGSSLYRATICLDSTRFVTIYDKCFNDLQSSGSLSLLDVLSHEPVDFGEFVGGNIIDIQCATFFTAIQTDTGQGYWWGLTPSCERNQNEGHKENKTKGSQELHIGDAVSISEESKCEIGAAVFNVQSQKIGTVMQQIFNDVASSSDSRSNEDSSKSIKKVVVSPLSLNNSNVKPENEEWDNKDVIYLHDQTVFHGTVVSFDNPFVIVKCQGDEKLRVCFKKNIVKLQSDRPKVTENNRYHKYIFSNPQHVLKDNKFKIAAMSVTELGLTLLLNRCVDGKTFLSYPTASAEHYPSSFVCPLANIIGENKNFKSDASCTVEYEAVPSIESNLCVVCPPHCLSNKLVEKDFDVSLPTDILKNICKDQSLTDASSIKELSEIIAAEDHFKFSRSFSLPAGVASDGLKRKLISNTFNSSHVSTNFELRKPCLKQIGTTHNISTFLFDNIGCYYPMQFSCCLTNPPLLEILPMLIFTVFEHMNVQKDERVLTIIAASKRSRLIRAMQGGDKQEIDNMISSIGNSTNSKRRKLMVEDILGNDLGINNLDLLSERCNGNQNVMHVAVSNIMKVAYTQLPNVNIMDSKHDEENYILQKILENNVIWPKVKQMLCERDSHGCTPFLTAIMALNVRGAYMILEAVKRDGHSEAKATVPINKQLFWKAICMPSFNGVTPLHAAVHCSSKKPFNQAWMNTLHVTNLPPNYSSRMLMKLFKARYPSAYRTIIGVPKLYYPRRTVRSNKSNDNNRERKLETDASGKNRKIRAKIYYPENFTSADALQRGIATGFGLSGLRRSFNQRSCLYQPKEGVVMFGDTREMFDAMNEMNNFVLLSKSDYSAGAVISVLQHIIQVQQYQEIPSDVNEVTGTEKDNLTNKLNVGTTLGIITTLSQDNATQTQKEGTISKCFDDIMVHFLVASLLNTEALVPLLGGIQGESAFSYFIKTYPRFSPSHLHKLFLNWRPCGSLVCKYNRHTGNVNITCHKSEPMKREKEKTKPFVHTPGMSMYENPILMRRGLHNRSTSLKLNVGDRSLGNDSMPSPLTPSIRLIDNLKFAPIELSSNSGLTPNVMQPATAVKLDSNNKPQVNFNPFFPSPIKVEQNAVSSSSNTNSTKVTSLPISSPSSKSSEKTSDGSSSSRTACVCHLSKARLLWNTTFEATHFLLAKNWMSIVASILCHHDEQSSALKIVPSGQLDEFLENFLTNPYSILFEIFIKTLSQYFYNSPVYKNHSLLVCLIKQNPVDEKLFHGKLFNSLIPWLTVHRFVRALVRQLSLSFNANGKQDHMLKYKIGRYISKNHALKETRNKDHLQLCLKAFSWLSVIEILQAANVMLKPILSGTVKGQAKSIIPLLTGQQQYGRVFAGAQNPHIRMHVPANSVTSYQRPLIRNATRLRNGEQLPIPSATSLLSRSSSSNECSTREDTSSDDDDDHPTIEDTIDVDEPSSSNPFARAEPNDLNEVDWSQTHGVTPDLAWAVDGHIHLRNEVSSRTLPPPMWQMNQQNNLYQQIMNTPSVHAGYLYLTRMFCSLVKHAVDLAVLINENKSDEESNKPFSVQPLKFPRNVEDALKEEATKLLDNNWIWMKNILDSLEKQLKTGEEFDTKHFFLRLRKRLTQNEVRSGLSTGFGRPSFTHAYGSTPEEYMVYLLKEDMGEADNSLPVLDLFSYAHIIYILDAYLYMEKLQPFSKQEKRADGCSKQATSMTVKECEYKKFFKVDLVERELSEEKTSLIRTFKAHVEETKAKSSIIVWLDNDNLKKSVSSESACNEQIDSRTEPWRRVIDAFSSLFITEGPGFEKDSFLAERAGSAGRISRFQNSLSNVRGTSGNSSSYSRGNSDQPTLLMSVVRSSLLSDCINLFEQVLNNHPFGDMRVRFDGEEGTGPGVNRGLFAAFTAQLKDTSMKFKNWPVELFEEGSNAQSGIFSPKPGKYNYEENTNMFTMYVMTQEARYQTFVSIGRFLGLTLWFNQNIPIVFSRATLLCLLGREEEICFDDLAYYDSNLYESFSHVLCDALSHEYSTEQFAETYCFCFEISINGHLEELCTGGKSRRVNKENIFEYIRLYTYHLLYKCRENEMQGLKDGLTFMIPKDLLDDLQPEDLQLLLSGGNEDVSYSRLRSIISFSNSRSCSKDTLEKYKTWFWKIVKRMTSKERQKLLYFATGSYVLPALDNRVGNNEELSITVDIIGNSCNSALPMSSTCGQRISIPLYPSKSLFRHKLMQAIECQTYGLG